MEWGLQKKDEALVFTKKVSQMKTILSLSLILSCFCLSAQPLSAQSLRYKEECLEQSRAIIKKRSDYKNGSLRHKQALLRTQHSIVVKSARACIAKA